MAFFTELTTALKHKWLQYFQLNRFWLARHMETEYVETPDGGRRPSSYLILGVVSALEPQLAELIVPFIKLNPDVNALIDVLELNFDPELFGGSSFSATAPLNESMEALVVLVNEEATDELSELSLGEVADIMAQSLQQESLEKQTTAQPEVGDVWLDEEQQAHLKPEQTTDPTPMRGEKRSEDDEISRLFPDF
jgi:hypothetical protein